MFRHPTLMNSSSFPLGAGCRLRWYRRICCPYINLYVHHPSDLRRHTMSSGFRSASPADATEARFSLDCRGLHLQHRHHRHHRPSPMSSLPPAILVRPSGADPHRQRVPSVAITRDIVVVDARSSACRSSSGDHAKQDAPIQWRAHTFPDANMPVR